MAKRKLRLKFFLLTALLLGVVSTSAWATQSNPLIFLHYWTGAMSGGIDEMTDAYNEARPEYQVKATGFEHESFKVSINAMLAGGSPPDIFSYWAGAKVQALVDANQLAPIDTAWHTSGLDKVFPPALSKACTYYGHKYALPITQHYVAFFYNVRIFNKLGLEKPANWEEFIAACETLKQNNVTPLALGSRERWPAQFWFDYLLLRTAGPKFRADLMQGVESYDDPKVQRAFSLWKALLDAQYFNKTPNSLDWADAAKLVHSGNAGMTLMGTWAIGLFDGQLGWKQQTDYDFFSFPVMDPKVANVGLGPIDVIVAAREGRAGKVSAALTYFSDPGPQMKMSKGSGALAPSQAIPSSFYSPLKAQILQEVRNADQWAFNYDLATPPDIADMGLTSFKKFVENPESQTSILMELNTQAKQYFETHK